MSLKFECLGCCWMSRAGLIVWRCDQTECCVYKYTFDFNTPTVETCFT
jgi:hypothetical protein